MKAGHSLRPRIGDLISRVVGYRAGRMMVSLSLYLVDFLLDSQHVGGWIYTNDAWLDPRPAPLEEWKTPAGGMTRRRRWTHRIYYTGMLTTTSGFEFE